MIRIQFEARHRIALGAALLLLLADIYIFKGRIFFVPLLAIVAIVATLPYWLDVMKENKRQKEVEARFPEFVRNLTGAIKSGMPAAQAVVHVTEGEYGTLTPHLKKLANQIEWSIPFHKAFINFGKETENPVIRRAIATVIQAEQAGGNIEDVLTSVTESLLQIKKIKEERKSSIHAQVMQSYIIFFVFLGVMIVIQNLLIPYMVKFGATSATETGITTGQAAGGINLNAELDLSSPVNFILSLGTWIISLNGIFLLMSMIQGFFAGVVLGKLAEGDLTSGIKHSLIMMTAAFMIITLAQSILANSGAITGLAGGG
ncbi:TPA: type II secretion system F family protein [Candidatus Woesearchaeota archaeon]|nr:type II secretion system F family protein [Candidatus Woesearchaeota archaeon]